MQFKFSRGSKICSNYMSFQTIGVQIVLAKFWKNKQGIFLHNVQAREEEYIQTPLIRNVYIFLNNNIVKIYRNMRIRIMLLIF